jgi:hypothetical protein
MASRDIIKIESVEQWNAVVAQYRELMEGDVNLKEHERTKKQIKGKLMTYMRKQLVDLNNEAKLRKKQLKKKG